MKNRHSTTKRLFAILLTAALMLTVIPLNAFAGTVNRESYIEIITIEDLYNIRNDLTANYILMNDIDLTEATAYDGDWSYGHRGWNPIGSGDIYGSNPFSGTFDGNGHTIKGMRISATTVPSGAGTMAYVGLFARVDGIVRNLTVAGSIDFEQYMDICVGGFAGAGEGALFEGCKSYVDVYAKSGNSNSSTGRNIYAGGLVGNISNGTINMCVNNGKVETCIGGASSRAWVSGIAGKVENSTISNSYNSGNIYSTSIAYEYWVTISSFYGTQEKRYFDAYSYVNGVSCGGTVKNSYNSGVISGEVNHSTNTYSGIAYAADNILTSYNVGSVYSGNGMGIGSGTILNSYYLNGTGSSNTGSTALSAEQMKKASLFNGFNFENTWTIIEDSPYPYPQLQGNIDTDEDLVTSVIVSTVPSKVTFLEGKDNLNTSGGVLTVEYKDSRSETIDIDKSRVTGFDNTKVGTQTLTVHFGRHIATYDITVVPKTLSGISVTQAPTKTDYIESFETLDLTGGKLTLHYDNDTAEEISLSNALITGFDNTVIGEKTLTATYKGFSTTFTVNVIEKSVASIDIYKLPDKLEYIEAKDLLDLTGGKIKVYFNNGTNEIKDLSATTVTGFNNTTVGEQELTVNYEGCQTTFFVDIVAKSISEIRISTLPDKTNYIELLEQLDVTGGKLKLIYDNGFAETIDLTLDMVVGFDNATVGKNTITVYYEGFSTTFDVNIIEKSITKIEMDSYPDKLTYLESKDTLDITGGVIKVIYNNDTEDKIELTEEMISGFSNTTVGAKTLTVFYLGKTTTFDIEIIEKTLTGIEISSMPAKLTYLEGKETLSVVGGRIKLIYDNGTSKNVSMTNSMVVGFDNNAVGAQTLTVIYEIFTAEYEVEIVAKSVSSIYIDTKPSKLTFTEGVDVLVTTGGKLHVNYNNGTNEKIDILPVMVSGFNNAIAGKQTLTVTYGEKTATYKIEIMHNYVSRIVAPTCTENGYTEHECAACKDKYTDNEISALGHSFTNYVSNNNATCMADGTKTAKCDHCNATDTKIDEGTKLAHTEGDWIIDTPAAPGTGGKQHKECTVCHTILTEETIPALPMYIPGDINGDDAVNNKDLTRLFQYLSDWDVEVDEAALDVNGDGAVNNKDLTRLFQYLSDWDVEIF